VPVAEFLLQYGHTFRNREPLKKQKSIDTGRQTQKSSNPNHATIAHEQKIDFSAFTGHSQILFCGEQ
jgi:hypothetical protein